MERSRFSAKGPRLSQTLSKTASVSVAPNVFTRPGRGDLLGAWKNADRGLPASEESQRRVSPLLF